MRSDDSAPRPGAFRYTPDSANRALPYVRRVVEDLVRDHEAWRAALATLGAAAEPTAPETAALRRRVAHLAADVEAAMGELAAMGVECKGVDVGLVDFPAEIDGAPACLCWQLGEPSVAWWHRPDAGYAGRQPLAAEGTAADEALAAGAALDSAEGAA